MTKAQDRTAIVDQIQKLITEKLFHPWWPISEVAGKAATLRDQLGDLQNADEEWFESLVNTWLGQFGLSHMAFFHVSGRQVPAALAIGAELRVFENGNGAGWYVQHLAQAGIAEKNGLRLGDAILSMNGQPVSPPLEPRFQLGKSHELVVQSDGDQDSRSLQLNLPHATEKDRLPMLMPKPIAFETRGQTGILKVAAFPGAVGFDFAKSLDNAIANMKAQGCDRLIVDLRGNPGGGLGSLRLMSYLVPGREATGYSLTRQGRAWGRAMNTVTSIDRIPGNKLGLWTMAVRFGLLHKDRSLGLWTESLGQQSFHGRTVLLVDEFTKSAAEMVAAFAAKKGAAQIVGAKTPGQVLGAANFKLPGDYRLRIPVTAWYMWDGDLIEGKGVIPHREIRPTPESLRAGMDVQLQVGLETVRKL